MFGGPPSIRKVVRRKHKSEDQFGTLDILEAVRGVQRLGTCGTCEYLTCLNAHWLGPWPVWGSGVAPRGAMRNFWPMGRRNGRQEPSKSTANSPSHCLIEY